MIKTRSEKLLLKRATVPEVSQKTLQSVSQHRRTSLGDEINDGKFRIPGSTTTVQEMKESLAPTALGNVTVARGINKKASLFDSSGGGGSGGAGGWRGSGGTVRQGPELYSPLLLNSSLNIPRDRATINAWARNYYAMIGFVTNAIMLHSTYPISKLSIKCSSNEVGKFFEDQVEELDLMNVCVQIAQEYFVVGEAFPYAELDLENKKWSRIILQNPDYIVVTPSVVPDEPIISLRPDERLKRICSSNKPADVAQRFKLDKAIVEHVRRGENIPLDNFNVHHIARKLNPMDIRGTSLILGVFHQLMLFQKIRESKYAQAESMINPLTLVKVGSADHKPGPADLEAFRETFEQAQADKDFKIITHQDVTIERNGAGSAIYDTSGDITQLRKEIFEGLMVPSVLMDGGADTTYANGGVALDALKQRYMTFRNMMTTWLRRKIFAPIAKMNNFYEYKDNKKILIVPEIDWNHMSLFDAGDHIQTLKELAAAESKRVSYQTLYRSLGLVWEEEKSKIREEDLFEAIREKEKAAMKSMSLNELRSVTPGDEIQEKEEAPLPGQEVPGETPAGGDPMAMDPMAGGDAGGEALIPPPPETP